jgi:hypothetical protein
LLQQAVERLDCAQVCPAPDFAILHYQALKAVQTDGLKGSLRGKFKRTDGNDTDMRGLPAMF